MIPPVESVGNTTCDMKTFQAWWLWLLGSTCRLEPYQTASARPAPPALIHGNTLVASPVAVDPSLTWTGAVHLVQPDAALEAATHDWSSEGSELLTVQTTNRFRALCIDSTENSVSGKSVVSAIFTSLVRSWPPAPLSSRKWRLPDESGVPMFMYRPGLAVVAVDVPQVLSSQFAAWKTLPVTWSIAG